MLQHREWRESLSSGACVVGCNCSLLHNRVIEFLLPLFLCLRVKDSWHGSFTSLEETLQWTKSVTYVLAALEPATREYSLSVQRFTRWWKGTERRDNYLLPSRRCQLCNRDSMRNTRERNLPKSSVWQGVFVWQARAWAPPSLSAHLLFCLMSQGQREAQPRFEPYLPVPLKHADWVSSRPSWSGGGSRRSKMIRILLFLIVRALGRGGGKGVGNMRDDLQ